MGRTAFASTAFATLFLSLAFCSMTAAAESQELEIGLERKSINRSAAEQSAGRPSTSRPAAGTLPAALRIEIEDAVGSGDPSGATAEDHALETRAAVAAAWSAKKRIERSGRPQAYRAGFYQGLRAALRDPLIGAWDYQQGIVAGKADPQAHLAGAEIGLEDAERAAEESARRLDPQIGTPVFTASMPESRFRSGSVSIRCR